jgi:hypothetical protein
MRISEIRDIIRRANWTRHDLTGGTCDEFRRQDVGGRLAEQMEKLRALQIPARFVRDIEEREHAIDAAAKTIARWIDARAAFEAPKPTAIVYAFPSGRRIAA